MAAESEQLLQFVSFSSAIDIGFWHKLTKNKLEQYKLDESPQNIFGTFVNNDPTGLPCRVNVDYSAFEVGPNVVPRSFLVPGQILVKNTIENFKTCNKKDLQNNVTKKIIEDMKSGAVDTDPCLLARFLVLTYPDLKKYHFYYWFLFPAIVLKQPILVSFIDVITTRYNEKELVSLQNCYDELNKKLTSDPFVFLLRKEGEDFKAGELKDWETFFTDQANVIVGFSDASTLPRNPGWALRNLLTYLLYKRGASLEKLTVICYRDRIRDGRREVEHSLVLEITNFPHVELNEDDIEVVGWEKNPKDKMCPRIVNLSSSMDPVKLSESAVDLNLKLMRWRLIPQLDLGKITNTKCLLLGSGTLGCNVARGLMSWGVRHITFVDNATVSYSNPVRQSLFQFDDCLDGGKRKAQAAADSLKRIFPSMDSSAYDLSIPMPGHAVPQKDEAKIKEDVELLEKLISEHDALFLLMDTRESRWLPAVIAASKQKIVINAALGFDTFMVMRHGALRATVPVVDQEPVNSKTVRIAGNKLGCYFCNDVVAPGNSTQDRTLDQQCTVSRPGISMMAGAVAVELLVSVLQHPLGILAHAETSANENHLMAEFETPIGIIPHQIRCFLSRFHTVLPATCAFDKCTGCCPLVIDAYEKDGFKFLLEVFNVPKYLEDMTGLTELQNSIVDSEIWELSDYEDDL